MRYAGWYSNRARGERAKVLDAQAPVTQVAANLETASEFATRARATWARLISGKTAVIGPKREERPD